MVAKKAYTTNQILADIADLRGQIAHLQQNAALVNAILTGTLTVDFGATILGEVTLNPRIVGLSGAPVVSLTDANTTGPISATSATAITKAWSIPANDAVAGTTYRLSTWGSGTQSSTPRTLSFSVDGFGITNQAGSGYPTSFATASQGFTWNVVAYIQVTATGTATANVTYIWNSFIKVTGASASQPLSGGGTTSVGTTTSSENINLNAFWGGAGGSISSLGSTLERIGT